jgi:hypothetical protein
MGTPQSWASCQTWNKDARRRGLAVAFLGPMGPCQPLCLREKEGCMCQIHLFLTLNEPLLWVWLYLSFCVLDSISHSQHSIKIG